MKILITRSFSEFLGLIIQENTQVEIVTTVVFARTLFLPELKHERCSKFRQDTVFFPEFESFKNHKNKWAYAYLLTPQGLAQKSALTGAFLKLKLREYQELKAEIDALSQEVKVEEISTNQL